MLKNIWTWILSNIFQVKTETKPSEIEDNSKYAIEYERIDEINFNAIFSNKIANYTMADSELNIEGDNARTDLLNKTGQSMWKKGKKITSMSLGTGGVALIPFVRNNKLYYSVITQNRYSIDEVDGDNIIGATVLSERKDITKGMTTKSYLRWTNYRIENGNAIIEQKYSDENGQRIDTPDFWINIEPKKVISNVDRVPIGFVKSPINNRNMNDKYGVPITYGCESTIKEIKDCMKQIVREFELKEAFVGADITMFNGKNALPTNGLYKKIDSGEDNFWEVFDPAIRESSYYVRLEELYRRLEREIGTSAGILSQVQTQNATATEIKRAMYDTFTIVDDMRSNIEKGLDDFFYACNVLANYYNLTPMGDYETSYEWSYSLIEDTETEWNQLTYAENKGIIDKVEIRQWLKPDETQEEAEQKIAEIKEKSPSISDLLGE